MSEQIPEINFTKPKPPAKPAKKKSGKLLWAISQDGGTLAGILLPTFIGLCIFMGLISVSPHLDDYRSPDFHDDNAYGRTANNTDQILRIMQSSNLSNSVGWFVAAILVVQTYQLAALKRQVMAVEESIREAHKIPIDLDE